MRIDLDEIKDILLSVEQPSRYTGGEYGVGEVKESDFNFCMCFPENYEVGMSNLGMKIIIESMKNHGFTADRCFAPWKDFGAKIKEANVPLYSLDMKKPLKEFDMLGFSLQFELCYTNLLYMLDLAQIPLLREQRGDNYPIIACGGPCAVNPEPLADFVDIFFIGDGEEIDALVGKIYVKHKNDVNRDAFYEEISHLDGVYVPKITKPVYENGKIVRFDGVSPIKKALIKDLDNACYPTKIPVPNCEAVHDRAVIEVMRGCYRGCRFCQAGFIYRPVRTRSVEKLTSQACELIKNTGYEEVSMNSLSTGDYKDLRGLIRSLKNNLPKEVTLALPSLRVDSFDNEFAQDSRRASITFAPEAGTQRLRDVINKDVTREEILKAASSAFDIGYHTVKLYFMLGLPTETEEDLQGIADIVRDIQLAYKEKKRSKSLKISVSVSTFIPKPFTPFQWERQATSEEVEKKQAFLRATLKGQNVSLSWNDYFISHLECAFARGDRRLSKVLLYAYENGAKFDGWTHEFNREAWEKAFERAEISLDEYSREYGSDEVLPWDFIDVFVTKKYLLKERERAYSGQVTGSCQTGCKGCGLQKEYRCEVSGIRTPDFD